MPLLRRSAKETQHSAAEWQSWIFVTKIKASSAAWVNNLGLPLKEVTMNNSKNYRIRTAYHLTEGSRIIGYRATREAALELALQQSVLLRKSIEVQERTRDRGWEEVNFVLNPEKFSWGGDEPEEQVETIE
jgi:hypothetical protein